MCPVQGSVNFQFASNKQRHCMDRPVSFTSLTTQRPSTMYPATRTAHCTHQLRLLRSVDLFQ